MVISAMFLAHTNVSTEGVVDQCTHLLVFLVGVVVDGEGPVHSA